MTKILKLTCTLSLIHLLLPFISHAQYRVDFNEEYQGFEPNNLKGWTTRTGDGNIIFRQKTEEGSVSLIVDPLKEKRNVWYAFMHQSISDFIDFKKLKQPEYELRMEAKVMASHAPRRINMYLSSLDAGGYLREFDLGKANEWYTISMVTSGFDFDPKEPLMTQVSMMDWGNTDIYELKVDYIKVDLVKVDEKQEQYGEPLVYRPVLKDATSYKNEVVPSGNASIDAMFPDEVLSMWKDETSEKTTSVVQVDQSKTILLKWDLSEFKGKKVTEAGQLEISTDALFRKEKSPKDFGEIRLSEILGVVEDWDGKTVTYNSFLGDNEFEEVVVSQCIADTKVSSEKGGKTIISISKPVLQRLIDGESNGIAIKPLGLISASFYDNQHPELAPKLRFTIE